MVQIVEIRQTEKTTVLGILVLFIVIFGLFYWYRLGANYYERAMPYIVHTFPELTEWNFANAQQFFTDETRPTSEEDAAIYQWMSSLGSMLDHDAPQLVHIAFFDKLGENRHRTVDFEFFAEFETGPARVLITLVENGDEFAVVSFYISAKKLIEISPPFINLSALANDDSEFFVGLGKKRL